MRLAAPTLHYITALSNEATYVYAQDNHLSECDDFIQRNQNQSEWRFFNLVRLPGICTALICYRISQIDH